MSIKCLLLETKDKKFFTLVKNKKNLREYCRAFGAKTFVVKADINKNQIMDITKLVAALCDKSYKTPKAEYKVLKSS